MTIEWSSKLKVLNRHRRTVIITATRLNTETDETDVYSVRGVLPPDDKPAEQAAFMDQILDERDAKKEASTQVAGIISDLENRASTYLKANDRG